MAEIDNQYWLDLSQEQRDLRKSMYGVGAQFLRPLSQKYDNNQHKVPEELNVFRDAMRQQTKPKGKGDEPSTTKKAPQSRSLSMLLRVEGLCYGDVGLFLSIPGSGLGNAAIGAVGTAAQKARFSSKYASMAITEPNAGSDSKSIVTTAKRHGDEWVINGEKIFITDGRQSDVVVVWATIDASLGKAGIRSFVVEKDRPGCNLIRLEKKLGIRVSDTATIVFDDCRIPLDNLLGELPESTSEDKPSKKDSRSKSAFGGAMQTFDNTRPMVAIMAVGLAQAVLDDLRKLLDAAGIDVSAPAHKTMGARIVHEFHELNAEVEAARLLTYAAGSDMDRGVPNSLAASMAKAKAGRTGTHVALRAIELAGAIGYGSEQMLEKYARDSKILDIFEGTQQIQQLIVARHMLQLSSRELK